MKEKELLYYPSHYPERRSERGERTTCVNMTVRSTRRIRLYQFSFPPSLLPPPLSLPFSLFSCIFVADVRLTLLTMQHLDFISVALID